MKLFSKKEKENKNDTLTVEMNIETRKLYKNVTRHKGKMVPVVDWTITLYINGDKLDEDEVFVEEEFFKTLLSQGSILCSHVLVVYLGVEVIMLKVYMKVMN